MKILWRKRCNIGDKTTRRISMKVHFLQHVHFENLGYIEQWLKHHHHGISKTKFFEKDHELPSVPEIDALIVMGGPMGVYDENEFNWLHEEKLFIKECIATGKKVLGICLGAQLIADCLGARVTKAMNKEIGWWPVIPTEACRELNWFYELFQNNPIVFHWHGDQFQIPDGSADLLVSPANTNQAFIFNNHVIGLQFHLEVTEDSLALMLENGSAELKDLPFIQSTEIISAGSKNISLCNEMMSEILQHWIAT